MKKLLPLLALGGILFSGVSSGDAERMDFDRPAHPGEHFECRIHTRQSARYSFRLPGRDEPSVKLESLNADFRGYLTVLKVNSVGNPSELLLRADSLSGSWNGKKAESPLTPGTVVTANLAVSPAQFRRNGQLLTPEAERLLRALFHPAGGTRLSDLTGPARVLPEPGKGWAPKLDGFFRILAARKIKLSPSAVSGGVTYFGQETVDRIPCRKFGILLETRKPVDYDFRLRAQIWLAPQGPPIRMSRNATELVRQVLSGNQSIAAGTQVELLSEDDTEQWLLPVAQWPAAKSESRRTPRGEWDLLRR